MAARITLERMRPTGHGRARGLVSSRTSGSRVQAASYLPSEDMRPLVASYWTGSWDLRGQPAHVTEMLGDPCVHFVFERGTAGSDSRCVGVWTRLWRRRLQGVGSVRGVKVRAGAVRAFSELTAERLANRITPLGELFAEAPTLEREVLEPRDDEEAFGALEGWLRRRAEGSELGPVHAAVELVDRIARRTEITTVRQLADETGSSPRALQRLFREHVGAPPKWVIRRNRLQEVALRIEQGDVPTLAMLAAELGYSDQAHLARDFKSVVGRSPSEFSGSVR